MRILFLLALSFYSFAAPTDFSECKGKEANYYVAKITKGGSAAGWLQASKMHQKFYKDRGSDIMVMPMMQYRRDAKAMSQKSSTEPHLWLLGAKSHGKNGEI